MNVEAYIRDLETLAIRVAVFQFAVAVIVTIIMFWLTYLCIRNAVRDGITLATPRQRAQERSAAPPGYTWKLIKDTAQEDMRAER